LNKALFNSPWFVITAGLLIPLTLALFAITLFEDSLWPNVSLHALMEGAGVILNLSLGLYLLSLVKTELVSPRFIWPAASFLTMAVMGGFHGTVEPSNTFVGLHSIGVLIGGLLMAIMILPIHVHHQSNLIRALPWLAIIFGLAISLVMLIADHNFPSMLKQEGQFSEIAIAFNTLGGLAFLATTLYLLFKQFDNTAARGLATLTLLFFISAVLFEYSVLWDPVWWLWHLLRFVALSLLLGYFFYWFYQQAISTKHQAEKFETLAFRDSLTCLPNRAYFHQQISYHIKLAHRNNQRLGLLFIDLDRFKQVNDQLGHHIGDQLLTLVADRLAKCVRETDLLARMGGDEFTIILNGEQNAQTVKIISQNILSAITPEYLIGTHSIEIGASIGVAFYPDDASEVNELMRLADTAMYQAKEQGRNTMRFINPALNTQSSG